MTEIRDPVHGPIHLEAPELRVVDSLPYQRLRHIKQLGFAEMTFPGATHNRYIHGLGAMFLASRAFDSALSGASWLPAGEAARLRQAVRLAALLHDLGHPPLSHTAEMMLPELSALPPRIARGRTEGHASHEDMTLLLVIESDLRGLLDEAFGGAGVTAEMVAGLLTPSHDVDDALYTVRGRNLRPLLGQLVSSELDVDRMDYLLRDSYYSGVPYGRFDADWLIGGLSHHEGDGDVSLALSDRALFAFEDFLLSRFHMFVMVYFHHRTNMYDRMLQRFFGDLGEAARFPADPDAYCALDDPRVWGMLRESPDNPWARRVLRKDPLQRVADLTEAQADVGREVVDAELRALGMAPEWITSKGVLSRYYGRSAADGAGGLFVNREEGAFGPRFVPLEQATALFERYRAPTILTRLYVEPERSGEARGVVAGVLGGAGDQ